MGRKLHLIACLLLSFVLIAESLTCYYCKREPPLYFCSTKDGMCTTKNGYCFTISLYRGRRLQYRLEGCSMSRRLCGQRRKGRFTASWEIHCCDHHMCNQWIYYNTHYIGYD